MTTQQKQRLFWLAGIALAAFYFSPSIFHLRQTPGNRPPNAIPTPRAQRPLPASGAAPSPAGTSAGFSAAADAPVQLDTVLGVWQGGGPLPGHGMCNLRLELRRPLESGPFAGYPVLTCMPIMPGFIRRGAGASIPNPLDQFSPLSAVLSGTAKDGAIQFSADKVIGKGVTGCALTSVTVTPFGTDQIAAQWQEGSCEGGQILLRRIGK